MKRVQSVHKTSRGKETTKPSDELSIAISFRRPQDGLGLTKLPARLSSASVAALRPDPLDMDRALYELHHRGFVVSAKGKLTASVRCSRRLFEKVLPNGLKALEAEIQAAVASGVAPRLPPHSWLVFALCFWRRIPD